MANKFALILAIATLVTGIIWCFERFKWAPARRAKFAALHEQNGDAIDPQTVAKAVSSGWADTFASFFPVLLVVFVVRSFIYEPFQIPSGSMMPTLLIGDFILVEKFAYGIKDPITQTTLIKTGQPKRGDIAVFKFPKDPSLDYIKRVVGLPGDRVTYDPVAKQVVVWPSCGAAPCEQPLPFSYGRVEESDFVQIFSRNGMAEASGRFVQVPVSQRVPEGGIRLMQRHETLGEVSHRILLVPGVQDQIGAYHRQDGMPFAEWIVPAGHYFMMGDNRNNSADSRYWGFVPERNLVGRATAIWMSFEKQPGEWPTGIRFSRIGGIH
ncbi:signal peptidase I [Serratia microhaemolytica]|uniref:signal peptidase I n=1 Tax=Serratia microhaemolytica TaxID=2675110 RepID=UPI000FDE0FE9|nr:signal peptidase I [Serratia microhaemolytica]